MKNIVALSILTLFTGLSYAQQEVTKKCGHQWAQEEAFRLHPELRDSYEAYQLLQNSKQFNEKGGASSYVIPVVFHVLHEYGSENISDAQIYDAMEVINREFNSADPDSVNIVPEYESLIGNGKIQFKLAAKDPIGNCTNGIEHIYTHETNIGDGFSKVHQWNRAKYLNIWVVRVVGAPGAAAYAIKPAGTDGLGYYLDGIVSGHSYVGSIGTSNPGNESVLTHEIGHYLSLSHTWGDTNDPGVACGNDGADDTPVTAGYPPAAGCGVYMAQYPNGWIDCNVDVIPVSQGAFTFDSIVPTSGTMDPTPVPTPQIFGPTDQTVSVIYSGFSAVGVGSNPTTTESFGYDNWDTGALDGETVYANLTGSINLSKYYEFTVAPEQRGRLELESLVFDVARDTAGPRTFAVRWDVDGFANNIDLAASASTNPEITVDEINDVFFFTTDGATTVFQDDFAIDLLATEISASTPVTFRLYAWNSENAVGNFIVDTVMVNGTVKLLEDVQNYMDYSYCDVHFTPDQVSFMHNALEGIAGQRNRLWNDTTLMETGVADLEMPQDPSNQLSVPLCAPVSDFSASDKYICVNEPITFNDASWNATIDTWEWTFPGGSPATSTAMNPTVTFDTPGYKTITLTVTNAAGSDTETRNGYVYISPEWADFTGPASIDLNGSTASWFLINNPEDNYGKFELSNGTGYDNSRCYKLGNYKPNVQFADFATDDYFYYDRLGLSVDELITPSFDLRNTTSITVSFKYAYASNATQIADIDEILTVYASRNCGETWTPRTTIQGATLVTGGYAGYSDYAPSSNNEYVTATFNYTSTSFDNHTRFKFRFEASDVASNLYIDDIMITGTLSLVSEEIAELDLNVYPNPTINGNAINVSYLAQDNPVTFTLRDTQGKIIATERLTETNTEVNHVLSGTENLPAAYYFLEVESGDYKTTRKVVVL